MATEPKIFTKNYVNPDDAFTVSSGAGAWPNAYDRDKDSQWSSSGANSDATDVTVTIVFYEGSVAVSRTIDSLLLINHNIAAFDLYYWDGAAFQIWHSFTSLASATAFQALSSRTTSQVQLIFHSTQTPDQEKLIGEICLMALQLDFGIDLYSYTVQFRQLVKDLALGDGSLHRAVVRWTYNRIEKYECQWSLHLINDTLRNSLLSIKQAGAPFLWYPESITRPDEIWYVHWYDPKQYSYASYVKSAGSDFGAAFKEV